MSRLFTAIHLSTKRVRELHRSGDLRSAEAWMTAKAYKAIESAPDQALAALRLIQKPSVEVASEPTFFDDSEHFRVTLDYHAED